MPSGDRRTDGLDENEEDEKLMGVSFSDKLKEEIRVSGQSAYRISQETGTSVDAIQRFINGSRGLNLKAFESLCCHFGLVLIKDERELE